MPGSTLGGGGSSSRPHQPLTRCPPARTLNVVLLVECPRSRHHRHAVDGHRDDALDQQGSIDLRQATTEAGRVELAIDLADADVDISEGGPDLLRYVVQLVRPEGAPVAIVVVLERMRAFLARGTGHHPEPVAQVTDGCLAALAVAADTLAGSLGRGTPPQVVTLQLAGVHAAAAGRGEADGAGSECDIEAHRPAGQPGVDGIVDQFQQGIHRRPVVGEQRRRQARIDAFPYHAGRRLGHRS